jgi:phage baseplate assembly protein W|tara:strand:- start:1599 stop:1973 length:375 start_codon:yes stop_codon:yes gene_type:complete
MAEGLSVALPLRVDTLDGAYGLNKDLESMANQNLKMVILTNPGERIMSPSFGVGIRRLLFEPATPGTVETIKNRIQLQVKKYLPYIDLVNLRVFMSKTDATSLVVIIKYSIPAVNIVKEFSLVV